MNTTGERLTSLESDARDACHERAVMSKSITDLCGELETDRLDRKQRDAKQHDLIHGKDKDNPGLVMEVDRLKSFRRRVASHFSWLWGALLAAVGSLVAWAAGQFGDGQ